MEIINQSVLVTAKSVYPYGFIVPKGFSGEFKIVEEGDLYILQNVGRSADTTGIAGNVAGNSGLPRIVLTKAKRRVVRFVHQGRRPAKIGEYIEAHGNMYLMHIPGVGDSVVWTREEIEEDIP